ncbi:MAG TPA: secretin N-terminal domain-containing protein [Candidatus Acidoferrum sp.]|nr:secretin N-terminal domain-containing protein [Candidatus Acidoferrum sp.]
MRNDITHRDSWTEDSRGSGYDESAEVQRILRRGERAFHTFVFACLLVILMVLLAMRALSATADAPANTLRLNFHGARIDQVLEYLSDAAGFIIDKQTEVAGTLDLWSKEPVSREEAVQLLSAALKRNGCAVLKNGRLLTIVNASEAKISDLEIVTGNDPNQAEKSDETITQLIPVRYASASQLVNNLQGLLPASATLTVNESANTLILVATKAEIRRMLKIINPLDSALATTSSIQVFSLRHADAKELATLIPQIFVPPGNTAANSQNSRAQGFDVPGPGGFGPPGMPGIPDGAAGSGSGGGAAAAPKVVAVADERSNALVVSAPADLLAHVASLLRQLDLPANASTELRVFHLKNADATELASQLTELFPDSTAGDASQNQGPMFFGGGPPPPGPMGTDGAAGSDTSSSGKSLKQSRVLAVADGRTSSLIVSAGSGLMPQVAALVAQLDSVAARNEVVKVWELRNADPQDVNQVLQDLFNRNSAARNNNNASPLLGQNNPLTARQTQQQSSTSATANFGTGTSGQGGPTQSPAGGGF